MLLSYRDARKALPDAREPLDFKDGLAYLVKTDVLMGTMWFSFDKNNMANMFPLSAEQVVQIKALNRRGAKGDPVIEKSRGSDDTPDFVTGGEGDNIARFDSNGKRRSKDRGKERGKSHGGRGGNDNNAGEGGGKGSKGGENAGNSGGKGSKQGSDNIANNGDNGGAKGNKNGGHGHNNNNRRRNRNDKNESKS